MKRQIMIQPEQNMKISALIGDHLDFHLVLFQTPEKRSIYTCKLMQIPKHTGHPVMCDVWF